MEGLGLEVPGLGLRVSLWLRVQGSGFWGIGLL